MRVELLKELAVLRDKYLLVLLHNDPFTAVHSPEWKAFRDAFGAASLDAREMRVWRRIYLTTPDPPSAVVAGEGFIVEMP